MLFQLFTAPEGTEFFLLEQPKNFLGLGNAVERDEEICQFTVGDSQRLQKSSFCISVDSGSFPSQGLRGINCAFE